MSAFCAISEMVKSIESGNITDCNTSGDTDAMEIVGWSISTTNPSDTSILDAFPSLSKAFMLK